MSPDLAEQARDHAATAPPLTPAQQDLIRALLTPPRAAAA
jgi:hypothetical protein